MAEAVKIAIIIEGGVIQTVLTAGVPVRYVVVDYDQDGEEARMKPIMQESGETELAYVSAGCAELAGGFVLETLALVADE